MKIFIQGNDVKGWSVDHDISYLQSLIADAGHRAVPGVLFADAVHSVVWNQLLLRKNYFLRFKKVVATASNFITLENPAFKSASGFVDLWIAPSHRQLKVFHEAGVRAAYQPFFVDSGIFRHFGKTRKELACQLGIDYAGIENKVLFGSFQRDTEGSDLISPKWQKGPEMLVEALAMLPDKDKWLLLVAGPRRHYVIRECERRGIPYICYGRKPVPGVDDIATAIHPLETMSLMYNLIDCYLVTSKSEGGPKAVIEAGLCKTMIFSTRVGLAEDFLGEASLVDGVESLRTKLVQFLNSVDSSGNTDVVEDIYEKVRLSISHTKMVERLQSIYSSL